MPIVAAIAGVVIVAAAIKLGTAVGGDAALMFRFVALGVFVLAAFLALWLHHKRKSAELVIAKYHAHGDRYNWKRVSFVGRKEVRICPDCCVPVHDYPAQEGHAEHHKEAWELMDRVQELERLVAELLGGKAVEPVKEPPWTAVVEPAMAPPTVTENTDPPQIEEEEPRFARFREAMERING